MTVASESVGRWRTLGYVVSLVAIAIAFYTYGRAVDTTRDGINENRRAIYVSCTLLANTIIESGAAQPADATRLFVSAIQRVMTPAERKRFLAAVGAGPGAGGVKVPPCRAISEHPESVRAVPARPK